MKYDQYRYKFYLNARHWILIRGNQGELHPHTWEFTLDTLKVISGFVEFHEIEELIEKELQPYQDQCLNEVAPFDIMNPTLETICHYFKNEIRDRLLERGWALLSIEIAETPTRSYVIDLEEQADVETLTMQYGASKTDKKKDYDILAEEELQKILALDK